MVTDGKVQVSAADITQRPVFNNLIQLYLYDMAALSAFPLNEDGRYDYDFLDRFWDHPYLIHLDGKIAGFALVISHSPISKRRPCWFMAEFCVLRPYRNKGVGRSALHSILRKHPGRWEIAWLKRNRVASDFWPASIPGLKQDPEQTVFDGDTWASLSFDAGFKQKRETD